MVRVKLDVTYGEHVRAQFLHLRPRPVYAVIGVPVCIVFLGFDCWVLCHPSQFTVYDLSIVGLGVLGLVYLLIGIPYHVRRMRKNKFHQYDYKVQFDEDIVHFASDLGESHIPWDHFLYWKESRGLILVYVTRSQYIVFPKRLFGSENTPGELRSLLAEKVKKL
jgi:hypothetical protein